MARRNKTSKKRSVRRSGRKTQRRAQKQRGGESCTKDTDCTAAAGGYCSNNQCYYSGSPFL